MILGVARGLDHLSNGQWVTWQNVRERLGPQSKAPPGKAWKIIGRASALGEEVYIMEGAYYDPLGHIVRAPAHSCSTPLVRDLTLFIHCCSGEPDEILSIELIDFEPSEYPATAPSDARA